MSTNKNTDTSGHSPSTFVQPAAALRRVTVTEFRERLAYFAALDDEGFIEPKSPFRWETLARVTFDYAVLALNVPSEIERLALALKTIRDMPVEEQDNMISANMRMVAGLALALAGIDA